MVENNIVAKPFVNSLRQIKCVIGFEICKGNQECQMLIIPKRTVNNSEEDQTDGENTHCSNDRKLPSLSGSCYLQGFVAKGRERI